MRQVLIHDVPVLFPYEPYDCQLEYLKTLISALQHGKNALLESPTGTGKTLCMLCGVLAWREAFIARLQMQRLAGNAGVFPSSQISSALGSAAGPQASNDSSLALDIPKVFYASRTHSQLSQVITELKKTSYRPKISLLSSREQTCIHPEISRAPTQSVQNALCRKAVAKKQCQFRNPPASDSSPLVGTNEIMDIEELVNYGKAHKACPYWLSRDYLPEADVVFLPYNYLFSPTMRKSQGIDLTNAIIIVDEAHNLEGHCSEISSVDISLFQLRECIKEAAAIGKNIQITKWSTNATQEHFTSLGQVLKKVYDVFSRVSPNSSVSSSYPGDFVLGLMKDAGLNNELVKSILDIIDDGVTIYSVEHPTQKCHLDSFGLFLRAIWRESNELEFVNSYYFYVQSDEKCGKTFGYWCMNPGVVMKELQNGCRIRNILLTSGTLSPMDSFAKELQIEFPFQLENGHVIFKEQLMLGVLPVGPGNLPLNSSFSNRSNASYKRELGKSIVGAMRSIPNGIIVFFSSYFLMDDCIACWKETDIWSTMEGLKKIFTEPRDKNLFASIIKMYCTAADDSNGAGAVLFAICRGKASEGIDFRDRTARAVIITGIPYPSLKDPKIELKRQFLDSGKGNLSGADWYSQQASRAVNQAIGRVIRHRNDFGVILLFDEKFSVSRNISHLSLWLRERTQIFTKYNELASVLKDFFNNNELKRYSGVVLNATSKRRESSNPHCVERKDSKKLHQAIDLTCGAKEPVSREVELAEKQIVCHVPFLRDQHDNSQELLETKMKRMSNLFNSKRQNLLIEKDRNVQCTSNSLNDQPIVFPAKIQQLHDYSSLMRAKLSAENFTIFEDILKRHSCFDENTRNATSLSREIFSFLSSITRLDLFSSFETILSASSCPKLDANPVHSSNSQRTLALSKGTVSQQTTCPICSATPMLNPMAARCKHSCCTRCWDLHLTKLFQCPVCNEKVRPSHLQKRV